MDWRQGVHQRSSNERVPVGGAPPTWINLLCVNLSALVILSHEENILADFYMCYNHTLGSEESTFIYTNLLHLSWPLKWNQIQHISYTLIVFLLRHAKGFKLKIKNNTSCIWCYKCSTHFTGENYTSKDYTKIPLITITQ